jgi:hypothetical protein
MSADPWRERPDKIQQKELRDSIYLLIQKDREDKIASDCALAVNRRILAAKMIPTINVNMHFSVLIGTALEEIKRLQSLVEHG